MPGGVLFVLKGVNAFEGAVDRYTEAMDRITEKAIKAAGEEVVTRARSRVRSRTGTLSASITAEAPRKGGGGWEMKVGPHAVYGRKHELGKRGKRHAGKHPYFEPGFHEAQARFGEIFRSSWASVK